jgi:hypothetical protein
VLGALTSVRARPDEERNEICTTRLYGSVTVGLAVGTLLNVVACRATGTGSANG